MMNENIKILYTTEETFDLLQSGEAVLVDVRDAEFYRESHITGAVNIPEIFYYLSESTPEGIQDMHRTFQKLFSRAGIDNFKKLIFYEDSLTKRYCGSCRGFWIGTYLGHPDVGILYGGLDKWARQKLPVESGDGNPQPAYFQIAPRPNMLATKDDVLNAIEDPDVKLLDDRDEEEWTADSSSPYGKDFVPRKGRIPGAIWIEWRQFMDDSGEFPAFKSKQGIRDLCERKGILPRDNIIIYCFKGARASNTYVALKLAGFSNLRIYFASWNEWARNPDLPIEGGKPADRC